MAYTSTKAKRPSANKTAKGTARISNIIDPTPESPSNSAPHNVAAATKSGAFTVAKIAGEAHDRLLSKQSAKAEGVGRNAIVAALRFVEQFKDGDNIDREALEAFLANETGKPAKAAPHGNVTNVWQPVAKAFSHEKALRSNVSKRAYVLAAVICANVRSEDLMKAFDTPEDVGSKKGKTGMEKYILLYKENKKGSKTGGSAQSGNPFDKWTREKLAKSAKDFLAALYREGFLSPKVSRIEDMLAGDALKAEAVEA